MKTNRLTILMMIVTAMLVTGCNGRSSSKANRQEARMQEEQAMLQGKKTSIMIEDNGKQ